MYKISEFQIKDIVNLADGKKLGTLHDMEINIKTGHINALIVGRNGKWPTIFQKEEEIVIPWGKIKKIGSDIVFVDYSEKSHLRTIQDEVEKD